MAKARPNLAATLAKDTEEPPASPAPANETAAKPTSRAGGRSEGKGELIQAFFPKVVREALEDLQIARKRATGKRVTLKDLMAEAFNDLFKKYGMPEVAPTKD